MNQKNGKLITIVTFFTKFPLKSWATQTVKAALVINTRASITTWTLLTLVNVCSNKGASIFWFQSFSLAFKSYCIMSNYHLT